MFFKKSALRELLEDLRKRGEEDKELAYLLKGVQRLSSKTTEEVMRPRVDVVMVSEDSTLADLVEKFREHRYSKYPVLSDEGDKIVGVAHVKDVFFHLDKDLNEVYVSEIMRPPFFIPATQSCHSTLKALRSRKLSIGLVVDEYGSVIGIVTIEDLVEEIVGEIYEEHDLEQQKYVELEDGSYLVSAWMPLSELEELIGVNFGDTESTSVGGFLIEKLGGLPEAGEVLSINGVELEAKEVTPQRILSVVVRKTGGNEGNNR